MRKYQEPQMNILELLSEDIITESNLYEPGNGTNTGGNEGSDWNDFWN